MYLSIIYELEKKNIYIYSYSVTCQITITLREKKNRDQLMDQHSGSSSSCGNNANKGPLEIVRKLNSRLGIHQLCNTDLITPHNILPFKNRD